MSKIRHADHSSTKNFNTTLFLCFFLGIFGLHRFYVGKLITGAMQLACGFALVFNLIKVYEAFFSGQSLFALQLCFIAVVLLIWPAIDSVLIVLGKFTDVWGRFIRDPEHPLEPDFHE
jgi:TM2 domain-containing membrane protein YozV